MKQRLSKESRGPRWPRDAGSIELERAIRVAWRDAAADGRVHEIRRKIWSDLVRRLRRQQAVER